MAMQKSAKKATPRKKYDPVACPNGLKEMCTAINKWAEELYAWALEVEDAVFGGGPTGTNPPPPPPFKP